MLSAMIELHRLGHSEEPFFLNPSLVVSLEAHPDTTLVLATGTRLVVAESIDQVVEKINGWHASIASAALKGDVGRLTSGGPVPLRPA